MNYPGLDRPAHVLLVDDDEVDRAAFRRALKAAGVDAELEEADDLGPAVDLLGNREFDCVFLDYELPSGNATSLLETEGSELQNTVFVILTGHHDVELAVELMKLGAVDYLAKGGLTPSRLSAALSRAVRIGRAERETRQAHRALAESEARFRALHETSPDGFLICRSVRVPEGDIVDFQVVYANPAAGMSHGTSAEAMVGRRLLELWPVTGKRTLPFYRDVVESGQTGQIELSYDDSGTERWFRLTAARLEDGFAVSYADVTAQRTAQEERERSVAARARFYASMSHELRTPINAILGYNALLLEEIYGPLSESQRDGLGRLRKAAQHLLDLINDVLDLSKLESGRMDLRFEEVRPAAMMSDLLITVRPVALERSVDLILDCASESPPVVTDPIRLRQILLNLISNAIKFGAGAPVTIRCLSAHGAGLVVEVSDEGPGIPPEHHDEIFEEFVQLPNSSEGGTGLGLPISRRLARLLGGDLRLVSWSGGSTFQLTLPTSPPQLVPDLESSLSGL